MSSLTGIKVKIYRTNRKVTISPWMLNLSEEATKWAYLKTLLKIRV